MNPHVLIALSCDMSGISRLPRLFARHGIKTAVLAPPDFLLARSRAIAYCIPCEAGEEATAHALKHHLETDAPPYQLVILGDDLLNQYIARNEAASILAQWLPCSADAALNWSKAAFIEASLFYGLPVPKSVVGMTRADAETAALTIGFPLIFKEAAGCSGRTVFLFESLEQMQGYLASRQTDQPWVIQKRIIGDNVTADVLFNRGRVTAWASSIVEHTCNGPYSSSTARRFVPMPELLEPLAQVGQMSRAHGFCGIDFIRQADGTCTMIEMNCRPTVGHALSRLAGIDFGVALAAMLQGGTAMPQHEHATAVIPTFPEDIGRCIGERDIMGLLSWVIHPTWWRMLPWAEPRIFAKNLTDLAGRVLSGIRNHMARPVGYSK